MPTASWWDSNVEEDKNKDSYIRFKDFSKTNLVAAAKHLFTSAFLEFEQFKPVFSYLYNYCSKKLYWSTHYLKLVVMYKN